MQIKYAEYVGSYGNYEDCPRPDKPEYAFIGRSNVGKSSLINRLTGQNNLAHTSQNPGKTQSINHFFINRSWYLVDLPGYGWAKVSKTQREAWGKMIKQYILHRPNLQGVFVLIDIRIKAQENDLEFLRFLGEAHVPFVMIFTKADKLKPKALQKNLENYQQTLLEEWEELPGYFVSSAVDGRGCVDILHFISDVNATFELPEDIS